MKQKSWGREISVLLLPVLLLGAVAWWIGRTRESGSEPLIASKKAATKIPFPKPPHIPQLDWQLTYVNSTPERLKLELKAKTETAPRQGLPPSVQFSEIKWTAVEVSNLEIRRSSRWHLLGAKVPPKNRMGTSVGFSVRPGASGKPGYHSLQCFYGLGLRNLPPGSDAVRFRVNIRGKVTYKGKWPFGLKIPTGVFIKNVSTLEEPVQSPVSVVTAESTH